MCRRGISVAGTFCTLLLLGVLLFAEAPVPEAEAGWSWTIHNNHSSYLNQVGYCHVVGEVLNTGDQAMKLVKIRVTFYNASNNLVATRSDYTAWICSLQAGSLPSMWPYLIRFSQRRYTTIL